MMQNGRCSTPISTHTSRVGCDSKKITVTLEINISTHTSRVGCDFAGNKSSRSNKAFLLTHPVWDVTITRIICRCFRDISTHTSRVGCDAIPVLTPDRAEFLLTHPVWDVTGAQNGGRQAAYISTHTSRVGCDGEPSSVISHVPDFYSHIPCGM